MKLSVTIDAPDDSDGNSKANPDFNDPRISEVLEEYLREIYPASERYDSAEVSLTFMPPEEIRALNRDYRDVDEATDVLSFPMIDETAGMPEGMPLMLGDIVICPEEVSRLHPELSEREAMCLMVAHSFLHLLGYDHDTEEKESAMWTKQDEISRRLLEVLD
ncbi:MAG: rRNA maturation RNase YbeY [Synergistaceae bacterium]|nr:rRNA maturation RNase YbeY [Synergistaceae bacterium]MBQ6417490.1 rRNA maturation RNase YbeY [Synergistaceae bacterium]MBQ6983156.1 rRNA maturation RNase YbeY [Synergistaceae bacterium]